VPFWCAREAKEKKKEKEKERTGAGEGGKQPTMSMPRSSAYSSTSA